MSLRRYFQLIRERARLQGDPRDPDALPWGGYGLSSPLFDRPIVRRLQERLVEEGIEVEVTGRYDEQTAAAVAEAKRRRGIGSPPGHDDRAVPQLLKALGLPFKGPQ